MCIVLKYGVWNVSVPATGSVNALVTGGYPPLTAMILAALTNVALDLLFVLVLGWGIVGAAVATLAGHALRLVWTLAVVKKALHAPQTSTEHIFKKGEFSS